MRVYLDDARESPEGWTRTFTPEQTIELLQTGSVEKLSLDHDLGLDSPEAARTGYSVLLWLEAEIAHGRWTFPLPEIAIHSANPVGRGRMQQAIASIERLHQRD